MKKLPAIVAFLVFPAIAFAGFASNEVYFASIGRGSGSGGAQFYSTVWVTNLSSSAAVHFTFTFLRDGQSNLSEAPSFDDTLAPGQTRLYENVTETKLDLPGQFGAARITADGEIFASERVYNLAHATDDIGTSEGLFFAAVPKTFAIGLGEIASVQGVNQGSPTEDMRSNFDLVETTGSSCTVHVTLLDQSGTLEGATDVTMQPYGHVKQSAQSLLHSIATINDRIVATVTAGSGKVILAGEQLANGSQDSSGFEMSFKDSLLGAGTGVTSLNGLAGALSLIAGSNITLTNQGGNAIKIDAAGGSGGAGVTKLNALTGVVTLAHGANTTINVSGQTITIDAVSGSGTGITSVVHDGTLSGDGTSGTPLAVAAPLTITSTHDDVIVGNSTASSGSEAGVLGTATSSSSFGVHGHGGAKNTDGYLGGNDYGVFGVATDASGVGVEGSSPSGKGVYGISTSDSGVYGSSSATWFFGTGGAGVWGTNSGKGPGVYGVSPQDAGVRGSTTGGLAGIIGQYGVSIIGELGTPSYGVYSIGDYGGTGAKYFVEPHPTDPSKEIRYVCLEGPEAGTYFRGTARIVNGFATIEVPDHFRMVSSETGLTVQATPIGSFATLVVKSYGLDRIVIEGNRDVEFFYTVNGVRKAFSDFQPISENRDFVPRSAYDTMHAGALPAESVRRLRASGILNGDGTINLDTAHRLGWDQRPGWNEKPKLQ